MIPADLHVVLVYSNPERSQARIDTFRKCEAHLRGSGATIWKIEAAFGERAFEVTEAADPHSVQLRCDHETWLKEAMQRVLVSRLPKDARYIATIDADLHFVRKDWAAETLHQLQHFDVVQMFRDCIDLGPNQEVIQTHKSFMSCFEDGLPFRPTSKYGDPQGPFWHPGYAWAWTREAWDKLGGPIDRALMGAADHHMALALIGKAELSMPGGMHPNYIHMVMSWQERALRQIRMNVGYVDGTILHDFHGWKEDRGYESRWSILQRHAYDPYSDVWMDANGLPQLTDAKPEFMRASRKYFRSRNEDVVVKRPRT